MGTASLVLGIISIIFGFIPLLNYFLLFPALLGLVLGIVDIAIKVKHNLPRSESICGVVLNGLAIFVIAAWTVVIAMLISASGDQIQKLQPMIQDKLASLQHQRAAYVSDNEYPAAKEKEKEDEE
jgi:hypothetical protein